MSRDVANLTVQILKGIRSDLAALSDRIDETNARLKAGFDQLGQRLERVEGRLDHVVDFIGERYRDHEKRIRRLEVKAR